MLADQLDVSLPTVKRMLNKTSIPLDRMLAICQVAQIELGELIADAEKFRPKHHEFTSEQDSLFFNQPWFLSYFRELTLGGKNPDEIAIDFNLTQKSTDGYLIGLAKVGLIERDTKNGIHFLVTSPFGFGPGSQVLKRQQANFIEIVTAVVFSPEPKDSFSVFKPLRLSRSAHISMVKELVSVIDKYAFLSESSSGDGDDNLNWHLSVASGLSENVLELGEDIRNL